MKQTQICFVSGTRLVLFLFLSSPAWGQINVGDYTISGSGEIGGLPRGFKGDLSRFEEYRDIPESVIVPQLQLMIGGKKEDYYLYADSYKTGLNDQSYTLRVGRYGILDMEFQWDQIPHWFSDVARTPYVRSGGHTTVFSLSSKPTATTASPNCATSPTCQWLNTTAQPINLSLYNGIARFKVRYTPQPGWVFTAGYWQNHNVGDRAFGALFGTSPGSYNITELAEPIDYQTHNIELGGEYAANGWSVGLKYNGSIFDNLRSSIVWDNPMNLSGVGTACRDSATLNYTTGTGACRGRMDLYPNNQAHTVTLSGAATLPYKSNFMGTASYGVRLQDASFLPFTINSCYGSGPVPATCRDAARTPLPTISKNSLSGDVRPLLVNATLVNNFFEGVTLKSFYRYYGLSNESSQVHLPQGFIVLDTGPRTGAPLENELYSYAKNSVGFEGGYNFFRWLSAKFSYGYDRMHRHDREVFNADEYGVGPTFDIKPTSELLFRISYRHLWRNISAYNALPEADAANISRKFDEAARRRNRASLFAQYTPLDNLEVHWGFELTTDRYLYATVGAQNDNNYSPSFGFVYTPLEWLRVFADYNWDRNDWKMDVQDRTSLTQTPATNCFPAVPLSANQCWTSRGKDISNTISFGSDMDLIPNLLGFRLQYTFSNGNSVVTASGDQQSTTPASNYPIIKNQWYELLARFEYKLQQNLALRFGYYYNHATEKDFGVDIMKPWMGDVDVVPTPNANVARSVFLGDRIKGPFTANVGFVTLAFKF
jgi:MtrB/PioB family decaheme-associated outer membrane protein